MGSYKTAWLLLHKLRRAMIDPERTPIEGEVEVDETSFPYRRRTDPVTGGQGKSTVGKVFVIGAVERRSGRTSSRVRLARIAEDTGTFIKPFVLANTAQGCTLHTDASGSYVGIPARRHVPRNLSGRNALPAHVTFERVHRVFSNLKRWALGTFHGFREKHMDAYLNEFVFRWNRRRSFQSARDRLLGVGQSLPRTTYRDIVGDTSEWRRAHRAQILAMVSPDRLSVAKALARQEGMDLLDALHEIGPRTDVRYARQQPTRPALPPRRVGEERLTARFGHLPRRPRTEILNGYLTTPSRAETVVANDYGITYIGRV